MRLRARASATYAVALLGVSFLLIYKDILVKLAGDWSAGDNYSHGFLIVPLAIYFTWERRGVLSKASPKLSATGLAVVVASLAVLAVGELGSELFLMRVSMIGVVAGSILFVLGWQSFRILLFPLLFLLLMIPLPAIVFNQIAFPLQLLASRAGEVTLSTLGVPVLREGNLIVLASTTLEVAEACSGIRSLVSLLTLGLVYGYFTDPRTGVRTLIALSTIPIAIVSNAVRVAGTGAVAQYVGLEAAEGFFHTFSGWLVFMVGMVLLVCVGVIILRILPNRGPFGPKVPDMEAA
jgi:exosortase